MKRYRSETKNGGLTIVIDSLAEVVETGLDWQKKEVDRWEMLAKTNPKGKVQTINVVRDFDDEGKASKKHGSSTYKAVAEGQRHRLENFESAVKAITDGDKAFKERVSERAEELKDLALDLEPSLRSNFSGFRRSEDGFSANPDLLAAGEEKPCIQRKDGAGAAKNGTGDGAYRIVICTDVTWQGDPLDNAALVGALVLVLQQYKPVEVWVQQAWLGNGPGDGVTLFKLDFTGAFDPTELAFWITHPFKDWPFSMAVNHGLGRHDHGTSVCCEIPADIFLRGDMMKLFGIDEDQFYNMLYTDKVDMLAKWIGATAMQMTGIVGEDLQVG